MLDILFTGDCFVRSKDNGAPFTKGIIELMLNSANVCVNLETTVGIGGEKAPKAYNFQIPPQNLKYLKDSGVNITSVANNHSLDYGEKGFKQTINNLKNDFLIIGGANDNECIFKVNDIKYYISSYYGNGSVMSACDETTILNNIKKHRLSSDVVIVCMHWGEEYSAYPKPKQQQLARKLIDNGVDVIIGHHPHVPQGFELYKGKFIFYSLGNFNFNVEHPYHDKLTTTKYGYCVGLKYTSDNGLMYEIIPIHINRLWQPEIIEIEAEEIRFNKYFAEISKPLPKGVSNVFYYAHSAKHIFKNYYPSWRKQIKEQGVKQVIDMIKWHIHPSTYRYYFGVILSLFVKNPRFD
jgi:poly-gamma-glutamate synthesis protein (capsule biosynthesis protein)